MLTLPAYLLFLGSLLLYAAFWVWAMAHAWSTPKADIWQRTFWLLAILCNPVSAVWYWYVWKRWAFWILFTPLLGFFLSLPFVARSILSQADATKFTSILFALGTARLVVLLAALMIFPLILRLVALLHLGRNVSLSAMDRNDWVISFALPVFGFGAGVAYCARYKRGWALLGLVWLLAITLSVRFLYLNVADVLIQAGEERRLLSL